MAGNVILDRTASVAVITINRPKVLNALNAGTLVELRAAFREAGWDSSVRAVVVTGAGDKAFVAGADIAELADLTPLTARDYLDVGHETLALVETLGKPVIAAINGWALGGGCELALACTIRIASETARIGLPEVTLGLMPGFGGTQRLARLIGKGAALELMLSGAPISASEALRLGLVNKVTPAADVMTESLRSAGLMASQAPRAIQHILRAVAAGTEMPLDQACEFEKSLFSELTATGDMREGTKAFLEKRKPVFTGQ